MEIHKVVRLAAASVISVITAGAWADDLPKVPVIPTPVAVSPSQKDLERFLKANEKKIRNINGVVGVGIDYGASGPIGSPCLVISYDKKKTSAQLLVFAVRHVVPEIAKYPVKYQASEPPTAAEPSVSPETIGFKSGVIPVSHKEGDSCTGRGYCYAWDWDGGVYKYYLGHHSNCSGRIVRGRCVVPQ